MSDLNDDTNPLAKLTFKHSVVNEKEKEQINHHLSIHSKNLQRSNYLTIDDDIKNVQKTFQIQQLALREQQAASNIINGAGPRVNALS